MGNNTKSSNKGAGGGNATQERDWIEKETGFSPEEIRNMDSEELERLGQRIWEDYGHRYTNEIEVYFGPDGNEDGEEYVYYTPTEIEFGRALSNTIRGRDGASSYGMSPEDVVKVALAHYEIGGNYSITDGVVRGYYSSTDEENIAVLQEIYDKYGGSPDPNDIITEIEGNIAEHYEGW